MLDPRFVLLGFAISLIGGASYAIDTFKGRAKPNRVSWLLWAVAPLIAFAAELSGGVGWQALMTFAVGFIPLVVLAASFTNKQAYWAITPLDLHCGFSVMALILWALTRNGDIAIVFSILADGLASIPTVVKSYREPGTESYSAYLATALSAGITLLTTTTWNFAHFAFPAYIFLMFTLIFVLVKFPYFRLPRGRLA